MPQVNRRSLVYPALLGKGKAFVNYDNLQYSNPLTFEYFEFKFNDTKGRIIANLPKNSIIFGSIFVDVTELFMFSTGTGTPEFSLGIINSVDKIATAVLVGTSNIPVHTEGHANYMKIFSDKVDVYLSVNVVPAFANTVVFSNGRGRGFFQWLDLNLVESFREVRNATS